MTQPPDPVGAAPPDVLPPVKPRKDVSGLQVLAGFGIGLAGAWTLRLALFALLVDAGASTERALFAALFPTFCLVCAILWAARTGRKGWAIGMAIYAGVGGLLMGGTALFFYVVCSQIKL